MELKRIDRLISKAKTWSDLYKDLSTNKQFTQKFKGDVFERVTQAYLLTIPEYKSILSDVWLTDEVPRTVLKKLNLPSKDFGVDLIAKTNKGEYWTVQCKFRTSNSALNYKDLSTFINQSFLTAKNIKLAIVAHTSSRPIKNRKFLKELSEIGAGRWLELTDEEWNNIRKFCNRKPVKIVKRKPRPHQRKAIDKAKKHFLTKKNTRGKLIMPCATGKSLAAFWIAQALDSKKVIVAVPSLALIKQSLNDWTKEYMANGVIPEWLCICSDESTGKVDSDEFNTDTYDLGIPTTTDKTEIIEFLRRRTKSPKIIFTTYQSSPRLAAAAKASKTIFDLCILDEAHKTVGVQGKTFSTLLFDKEIKIKKRMFMTATERVLRGKNDEVASMDDLKIYGDYIYAMTFKSAIEQNIISDYKILTMLISNSEVDRLVEENYFLSTDLKQLNERTAQYLASGIALKKSFKKYKLKHAISFHRSISLAKQFQHQQDQLNNVISLRPKVENLHISSKKTSGERTELIKEFTELNRSLLTNARCLTEGVDVPAIDCVMFVDPKQSTVDIVQAAGRALRKYPSKEFGYILLPIVVPDGVDLETFSETSSFKKVMSIIASLSSQDERIAEEYRLITNAPSPSGLIIDIDPKIKLGKKIKIDTFSKAIYLKVWEKVAKVNRRNFIDAREYVRSLKLNSMNQYHDLHSQKKLPEDLPYHPERSYKNDGWVSMVDWIGSKFREKDKPYLPFKEAKKLVQAHNLKNYREYIEYYRKFGDKNNLPSAPNVAYKNDGYVNMGDFLGTNNISNSLRVFLSYEESKKEIKKFSLKGLKEFRSFAKEGKLPKNIPTNPHRTYSKEWQGYGVWLGHSYPRGKFKKIGDFKKARKFIHSLNLKSTQDWNKYKKDKSFPDDIPRDPRAAYSGKGFVSMGDWLGTGRIADQLKVYRNFEDARKYVRSLNLRSTTEWRNFKNKPDDIPANPNQAYRGKGWNGMSDWLGTGKGLPNKTFLSFINARKYARSLKLGSYKEWLAFTKTKDFPSNIPRQPGFTYKDEFKGSKDWLGIETKKYKNFYEARKKVRTWKLKNAREWREYSKSSKFPKDIYTHPDREYRNDWKGWMDFLGTQ